MCGLIATVEDGKLVKLRADKDDRTARDSSAPRASR